MRLCGSLWHNPHTKSYRRSDKYSGRQLDEDGFEVVTPKYSNYSTYSNI